MTSSTAQPRPSLSEDRQTNEPSMEEILASIRRLIAEDEAELGAASAVNEERRPLSGRSARAWVAASAAKEAGASLAEAQQAEVHARSAGHEADSRPSFELESGGYTPTAQAEAAPAPGAGDAASQFATSDEFFPGGGVDGA